MENNWIKIKLTDENEEILDLIDSIDLYKYSYELGDGLIPESPDEDIDEDYCMVEPNAWEKACKEHKKGRNRKKEEEERKKNTELSWKLTAEAYNKKKEGKIEEAIELYEKAISLRTLNSVPYNDLRMIYKKLKDKENELRVCKFATDLFPTNEGIKKRIRELEGTQPSLTGPQKRMKMNPDENFGDKIYNQLNNLKKEDFKLLYYEEDEIEDSEEYRVIGGEDDNYTLSEYDKLPELITDKFTLSFYNNEKSRLAYESIMRNDYLTATKIYEKLLAERYPYEEYYEGLRSIYQKFRLRQAEYDMLKEVLEFIYYDIERYKNLVNKLISWFPNSQFAAASKYGYSHRINKVDLPISKTRQIEKWEERLKWLERILKS